MRTSTQSSVETDVDYMLFDYLDEASLVGEMQLLLKAISPNENNGTGDLMLETTSPPSTSPSPAPFPVPKLVVAVVFSVPLVLGALENALIALVLLITPALRNPRALFLVSLALSDLLLCAFTEPMNARRLADTKWPFTAPLAAIGAPLALKKLVCRLVLMLQAVNVFASTFSVTAIAAERLNVILHCDRQLQARIRLRSALAILASIWLMSFTLASPVFQFAHYYEDPDTNAQLAAGCSDQVSSASAAVAEATSFDLSFECIESLSHGIKRLSFDATTITFIAKFLNADHIRRRALWSSSQSLNSTEILRSLCEQDIKLLEKEATAIGITKAVGYNRCDDTVPTVFEAFCDDRIADKFKPYGTCCFALQYTFPILVLVVTHRVIWRRIARKRPESLALERLVDSSTKTLSNSCGSRLTDSTRGRLSGHLTTDAPSGAVAIAEAAVTAAAAAARQVSVPLPLKRPKGAAELRRRRRAKLLLCFVVATFALSWLPLNMSNMLLDYEVLQINPIDNRELWYMDAVSHFLITLGACLNPIYYGWFNEALRLEFLHYVRRVCELLRRLFGRATSRTVSATPSARSHSSSRRTVSAPLASVRNGRNVQTRALDVQINSMNLNSNSATAIASANSAAANPTAANSENRESSRTTTSLSVASPSPASPKGGGPAAEFTFQRQQPTQRWVPFLTPVQFQALYADVTNSAAARRPRDLRVLQPSRSVGAVVPHDEFLVQMSALQNSHS